MNDWLEGHNECGQQSTPHGKECLDKSWGLWPSQAHKIICPRKMPQKITILHTYSVKHYMTIGYHSWKACMTYVFTNVKCIFASIRAISHEYTLRATRIYAQADANIRVACSVATERTEQRRVVAIRNDGGLLAGCSQRRQDRLEHKKSPQMVWEL